ncbi:MAG: hypothetical protein Q4F57_05565 [Weeksellaceae bacterium]|nr:hypothetical protein [Weeksellaceae bacterium]
MYKLFYLIFCVIILFSCDNESKNIDRESDVKQYVNERSASISDKERDVTSNKQQTELYTESEKVSSKAYRDGYRDGKMGYGLPLYQTATADEAFMLNGYKYSTEDYYVYVSGYNHGLNGLPSKY